jgi:uncharacterized spore protein YtfJ
MSESNFKGTVEALFSGMNEILSTKTVVGDAVHIGETIILPLVDVSFAIGAGAFNEDKKEKGAGAIGGKMIPSAILVIQNGRTRLVNIKNQDTVTKLLDMVPDVIDRFTGNHDNEMSDDEIINQYTNSQNGQASGSSDEIIIDQDAEDGDAAAQQKADGTMDFGNLWE